MLYITLTTHICGISSKSRVHPPGYAPSIPPHKPPFAPILQHFPCVPDIQTSFSYTLLYGINPPLPRPKHWATTNTLSYIDSPGNHNILNPLHLSEQPENTFINPFVQPLRHSAQLPYPWIRESIYPPHTQPTSEVAHLHTLILDLSFSSSHSIVSMSYIKTGTSNVSCKTLAHSSTTYTSSYPISNQYI